MAVMEKRKVVSGNPCNFGLPKNYNNKTKVP